MLDPTSIKKSRSSKRPAFQRFETVIEDLASRGVIRNVASRTLLFAEGSVADSVFVVLSGRVKIFVSDAGGSELLLRIISPGEYFGELLLDGGPRSASAMTIEPARLAIVTRKAFEAFVLSTPDFTWLMLRTLMLRLRSTTSQIKDLALSNVSERVLRLLTELATEGEGGRIVQERLTQRDIATRVGTTRETINKVMKDLSRQGHVRIDRKRITVYRSKSDRSC